MEGLQNFIAPETVTSLNISNNAITCLPAGIFDHYTNLNVLDLSENNISKIHEDALAHLHNLTELNLEHNNIETIPAQLLEFNTRLIYLNCDANKLVSIPEELCSQLKQLETAYFIDNKLTHIDSNAFKRCVNLKWLGLANNQINTIYPEFLQPLIALNVLLLEGNPIKTLPSETIRLINERSIFVRKLLSEIGTDNKARTAHDVIDQLRVENRINEIFYETIDGSNEYVIDLSFHCLTSIDDLSEALPESAGKHVIALYASHNYLTKIPFNCLKNYPHLINLDLQDNQITSLVETLEIGEDQSDLQSISTCGLNELEELNISCNNIRRIDLNSFTNLFKLKKLDLGCNKIEDIAFGAFSNLLLLKKCSLNNNCLTTFSETFPHCFVLKKLDLSGNNLNSKFLPDYVTKIPHLILLPQNPQPLKILSLLKTRETINNQINNNPFQALKTILSIPEDLQNLLLKIGSDDISMIGIIHDAKMIQQILHDLRADQSESLRVWLRPCNFSLDQLIANSSAWFANATLANVKDSINKRIEMVSIIYDCLSDASPVCARHHTDACFYWRRFVAEQNLQEIVQCPQTLQLLLFTRNPLGHRTPETQAGITLQNELNTIASKAQAAVKLQIIWRYLEYKANTLEHGNALDSQYEHILNELSEDERQILCELASPQLLDLFTLMGIRDTEVRQNNSDSPDTPLALHSQENGN